MPELWGDPIPPFKSGGQSFNGYVEEGWDRLLDCSMFPVVLIIGIFTFPFRALLWLLGRL